MAKLHHLTSALALTVASALAFPAAAWTSYHLEDNIYAILCDDGVIFSYEGSADGLTIVGPALCADRDTTAASASGSIDRASPKLMRSMERCNQSGGARPVAGQDNVLRCPAGLMPVNHNTSRSNVRG